MMSSSFHLLTYFFFSLLLQLLSWKQLSTPPLSTFSFPCLLSPCFQPWFSDRSQTAFIRSAAMTSSYQTSIVHSLSSSRSVCQWSLTELVTSSSFSSCLTAPSCACFLLFLVASDHWLRPQLSPRPCSVMILFFFFLRY